MSIGKQGIEEVGVHGAAQHTDVTRELFIPVLSGWVYAGSLGQKNNMGVVSGGANSEEPRVYCGFRVPDDFVSFTSLKLVWVSAAASGNMYWSMDIDYAADGEAVETHSEDSGGGVTPTGGANIINVQTPTTPLVMADLAKGDYVGIKCWRAGSDGGDTLDTTTYFLGFLLTYVAEQ